MSITDELRKYSKSSDGVLYSAHQAILAIADRIDAEHEAMLVDARKTVYKGYIELPKDADGEPIHVGDEMEEIDCDGGHRVFELRMCESGWWVTADGICRRPYKYRHYHAPTVEDVLTEMLYKAHIYDEREMELLPDLIADYAKRLTLAEGEDA